MFRPSPPEGPEAPMGWNMHRDHVVNDRVDNYMGSMTVSLSVRLLSYLTGQGWSDT